MKRVVVGALLLLLPACGGESGPPRVVVPQYSRVGLSPPMHVDRIFRSMEGPAARGDLVLAPERREILWITSYRTDVVDADGEPREGLSEFMCHNNMDFDSQAHRARFGLERPVNAGRMFTASQGVFEIALPAGFGIPVLSDERFEVDTQVLNHNHADADLHLRHRVTVKYIRDRDAAGRLKALYPTYGSVMALLHGSDGVFGVEHADDRQATASCAPGTVAPNAPEHGRVWHDSHERSFTQHWVVPPGREERRTLVTQVMSVPFDTTIHYVAAHLHPFAETLTLRDLTTGETLYTARARPPAVGVGLAHVDHFSSVEGIPVHRDHEYEMVSVYDNPTGVDQDAMATFFIYYRDLEMERALESVRRELAAAPEEASGA